MSEIRRLLERSIPGSRGGVAQHIRRGERSMQIIEARFAGIRHPQQLQVKHLLWLLRRGVPQATPATRYHYFRTLRAIASALNRWEDWEPLLRGAWTSPTGQPAERDRGGRPPKLAHPVRRRLHIAKA